MGQTSRHGAGASRRPRARTGHDRAGLILLAALLAAFALLAALVMAGQTDRFDDTLVRATHSLLSPGLTRAVSPVSVVGTKAALLLPVLIVGLLAQRRRRGALIVLAVGGGAIALNTPLKVLIHRSPPGPLPLPPLARTLNLHTIQQYLSNSYSFPSGHVLTVTVVFGLAVILLRPHLPDWASGLAVAGAGALVAVVGFSRVYLGTYHPPHSPGAIYYPRHFPSDVLGALLLGGAWLTVAILALRRFDAVGERRPVAASRAPVPGRPRRPARFQRNV
jgi:undecaprenyl-diphosphatase